MATSTKKSATQNDLRKLMKERRNELITKGKKQIDSPLAKYNDVGQLICIVCDVCLKNEVLWSTHITGKTHKEKLEILKRRQINSEKCLKSQMKRKYDFQLEQKETRGNVTKFSEEPDISSDSCKEENLTKEPLTRSSNLPKDFFDDSIEDKTSSNITINEIVRKKINELPEGFFDNPVLDAKVRKVEYKDPMEEEWEKFKKIMAEESNLSQAIIEEDMQESNVEREITQIDEQIHHWSRVEVLQEQKDNLMKERAKSDEEVDNSSGTDENEFEEFLDWRSKQVYKK